MMRLIATGAEIFPKQNHCRKFSKMGSKSPGPEYGDDNPTFCDLPICTILVSVR